MFALICLSQQTYSVLRIWSCLLYRAKLVNAFFGQEFAHIYHTKQTGSNFWFCQHFIIWANLFNTNNLIIFAIRSKLAQYQEFARNYQPMQISSILRVWICLLIQVNTPKLRFWANLQRFVSLLVIISLHVFTSEANVAQKRRSAHKFASCVNRNQINTFTSAFAPWANETKIHSCTIPLYKSGNL